MNQHTRKLTALLLAALLCLGLAVPGFAEEGPAPEDPVAAAAAEPAPEPEPEPETAPAPEHEPEPETAPAPEPGTAPAPEEPVSETAAVPEAEPAPAGFVIPFNDYVVGGRYDRTANELACSAFLREELDLNAAAVSGILANIERESDFSPHCLGDNGTSYGICQWHNGRFIDLRDWCWWEWWDYTSLEGQLHYLAYELETFYPDLLAYLRQTEDSAWGAYWAADQWCRRFECPDHMDRETYDRGVRAETVFFEYYGRHRVSFEPAGGILEEESRTCLNGETWGELPTPSRVFFDFVGWALEDGTVLAAEDVVALESDVTLHAVWTAQTPLADSPMLEENAGDDAVATALAEDGPLGTPRRAFTTETPPEPLQIEKPGRENVPVSLWRCCLSRRA